jgi:iron-sulfur cluster assembly protein
VGVKGGGCSGLMYDLVFDDQMKDGDKVFEDNGVKVVVDKKSLLYLLGTTLDFSGGLNGKGFQFVNPNANRTCGCGESFSVSEEGTAETQRRRANPNEKVAPVRTAFFAPLPFAASI